MNNRTVEVESDEEEFQAATVNTILQVYQDVFIEKEPVNSAEKRRS